MKQEGSGKSVEDQTEHIKNISNAKAPRKESVAQLALRKISDVASRKVSDAAVRQMPDSSPNIQEVKSRPSTLTFRDTMLSMIQPSSESGSDLEFESFSDSDDELEQDFEIVKHEREDESVNHESSGIVAEDVSPHDDTVVQKHQRKHSLERSFSDSNMHVDSNLLCEVTTEGCRQEFGVTSEVDGVDIDTDEVTNQEVSYIDQGEDMVILDVRGESKNPNASNAATEDSRHDRPEDSASDQLGHEKDASMESAGIASKREENSAVTSDEETSRKESENSTETEEESRTLEGSTDENFKGTKDSASMFLSPYKVAELSVDDINQRLSLQPPDLSECGDESARHQSESEESVETLDSEDVMAPALPLGKPVPLTRVKCLVSMTTPMDARAHGIADCPSFVEFDMSADGFGCLFLPAIAPQALAGKIW